jgi:hypothetical protein
VVVVEAHLIHLQVLVMVEQVDQEEVEQDNNLLQLEDQETLHQYHLHKEIQEEQVEDLHHQQDKELEVAEVQEQ